MPNPLRSRTNHPSTSVFLVSLRADQSLRDLAYHAAKCETPLCGIKPTAGAPVFRRDHGQRIVCLMPPSQAALRAALVIAMAFSDHRAQDKGSAGSDGFAGLRPRQFNMRNAVAESKESENIVVETAEKIFADLADAQTINHDKKGAWKAPLWQALSEAGLPLAWVPEEQGGSGASLAEGFAVLNAAGRHAIAVPLAETMLAGWLLAQAKIASPEGEMTVVPASPKDRITLNGDGSLSGRVRNVPFAKAAKYFAVLAHGKDGVSIALVSAPKARIEAGLNVGYDNS